MTIVKIHISGLKTSMDEITLAVLHSVGVFFDGADVLNLREKKDVFLLVSYIFETKNVD